MLIVSDVHGAVEPLRRVAALGEPLLVLGDLINYIDYRSNEGIVADISGRHLVDEFVRIRALEGNDAATDFWQGEWAHRDEGLEDRYSDAIEAAYRDVCAALRESEAYVTYGNVDRPDVLAELLPEGVRFVDAEVVEIEGQRVGFAGGGLTSIGTPGEVSEEDHLACLQALDAVESLFEQNEPDLVETTSSEALTWARINLFSLRAWQGQMYFQETDSGASFQSRDQGMAKVFLAIKSLRNPDDRLALWAHNGHILYSWEDLWGPEWGTWEGARNMGSYLREELEDNYFAIGLVGYHVSINWPGVLVGELDPPSSDLHVEYRLHHELGHDHLLIELDFPGVDNPFLLDGNYYFLNEYWLIPAEQFGAILYLDSSPMMDSLIW